MDTILEGVAMELQLHGPSFTMDSLAKRLCISKRTIYEKYESKNQMISSIFEMKIQDKTEQRTMILADESLSYFDKLIQYFGVKSRCFTSISSDQIRSIQKRIPSIVEKIEQLHEAEWLRLESFLAQGKKEGRFKKNVNISILLLMFKGIYEEMLANPSYEVKGIGSSLQCAIQMLIDGIVAE